MKVERGWRIDCPACGRYYVVSFKAPWRCPEDPEHGTPPGPPLRVRATALKLTTN